MGWGKRIGAESNEYWLGLANSQAGPNEHGLGLTNRGSAEANKCGLGLTNKGAVGVNEYGLLGCYQELAI